MKLELTKREKILIVFFLSLLLLGATIRVIRSGTIWRQLAAVTGT
jgi:hypothetical protein